MQHRSDRVDRIDVDLADALRRARRRDSHCIVGVELSGLPASTVVEAGADVRGAIDRAADRAGRLAREPLRRADGPRVGGAEVLAA